MPYFDLHRHDEYSTFDGFGKPEELVKIAKELGYPALGLSNHGNTSGLIKHYFACKEAGIKPIMGNEVYFMPKFKETRTSYHLCLFAKNLKGYSNLNRIVKESNENNFYYKAIVDFALLEKYHKGLVCTSACVGGAISKLLMKDKETAYKAAKRFKKIFGDDYYIELQPFALMEEGLQENVNEMLIELAEKLDIKCILTSDSHFGRKEDFTSYLVMHDIGGHRELGEQYSERYMPTESEMVHRFVAMHKSFFESKKEARIYAESCIDNMDEIFDKVNDEILEKLKLSLPKFDEDYNSSKLLWKNIVKGLKKRGKYKEGYIERCKDEYDVIVHHGYDDYFLIVQDYVRYAKSIDVAVGAGRGSVCNCLVAYALGITDVDSLFFKLDFKRFLRMDKAGYPDIDLDFETDRRAEIIDYLVQKYKGISARIGTYGLYQQSILLNDLFKVCGLPLADKKDEDKKEKDKETKEEQARIKKLVGKYIDKEKDVFKINEILNDPDGKKINKKYDGIIDHFNKMYHKVRYYGTHAAGVAISGEDILNFSAIERRGKDKQGKAMFTTPFDLSDIEKLNVLKFDMLGLRTMSILRELRSITENGSDFDYSILKDKKIFEQFELANTDGIFQFESNGGKGILSKIQADCYDDVIAASALNRPAPLALGMPDIYAENKVAVKSGEVAKENIFYKYAKETYGTFVFQEQIMQLLVYYAGFEWNEADKVLKIMKHESALQAQKSNKDSDYYKFMDKFLKASKKKGLSRSEALETFESLFTYAFNKGHCTGYAMISIEQMYYKVHYPNEFWYVTLKYANEKDLYRLTSRAVKDGSVILLPHVNGCALHSLIQYDGEPCIQEGMSSIKDVGEKAAKFIEMEREENGDYIDYDDFLDRIEPYKRVVNKKAIEKLKENGALEFNQKIFISRVIKYNSTLHSK